MRTIYTSREYGNLDYPLQIEADFSQSTSQIMWRERDTDEWEDTPFQVASFWHDPHAAIDGVDKWLNMC